MSVAKRALLGLLLASALGVPARAHSDEEEWMIEYSADGRGYGVTAPDGRTTRTRWSLDKGGRLEEFRADYAPDNSTTWTFDAAGRRRAMEDRAGRTTYAYDAFDRLIRVTRTDRPEVRLRWDREDRLTEIRVGDFWFQRYAYGTYGELRSIDTPGGQVRFGLDASGREGARILPNGARSTWSLDEEGRIERLVHRDAGGGELGSFSYAYRPDGLVGEILESTGGGPVVRSVLEYDALGRLRSRIRDAGARTDYAYDAAGNMVERRSTAGLLLRTRYDELGRVLSHAGADASDDAVGNLRTRYGAHGPVSVDYDERSVLREVKRGETVVRYERDGDGMLIARELDGRKTRYVANPLSDDWQPLWAADADGHERWFVWAEDRLIGVLNNDTWFLEDLFGFGRFYLDAAGALVGRADFDEFGRPEDLDTVRDFVPGVGGRLIDTSSRIYGGTSLAYDPEIARPLQGNPIQGSLLDYLRHPDVSVVNRTMYFPDVTPAHKMLTDYVASTAASTLTSPSFLRKLPWYESNKTFGKVLNLYDDAKQLNPWKPAKAIKTSFESVEDYVDKPFSDEAKTSLVGSSLRLGSFFIKRLGVVSMGFQNVKGAVEIMARPTRSRILQNRALGSLNIRPDVIPRQLDEFHEVLGDTQGSFSMRGERFEAHGTWTLDHSGFPNWTTRAGYRYKDRYLANGALSSGTGTVARVRYEAGDAVLDVKRSRSIEHQRFDGRALHEAVEAFNRTGDPADYRRALDKGYGMDRRVDLGPPPPPPGGGGGWGGGGSGGGGGGWGGGGPFSSAARGGISLAGVGGSIRGLGALTGVAVDPVSGRVILLAEDRRIELPPLRVSDLVAVFRGVYGLGESPSVTIEPYPQDPHGEHFFVRNDPATDQTFPGWAVYQCDRIMKGFSLGRDNETKEAIQTAIDGYQSVARGLALSTDPVDEDLWNRFEIVPDLVSRTSDDVNRLTLLSVSLKVETDMRQLTASGLSKAAGYEVPKPAKDFADWFTRHLSELASEVSLPAPPGFEDRGERIYVFAELRRIALMAAIAEVLRDQGVPMPVWMRDYEVPACHYRPETPSLVATEDGPTRRVSLFGGVRLTPPPEKIKRHGTYDKKAELADLARAMSNVRDGVVASTTAASGADKAVALPGTGGAELGACRRVSDDLTVPLRDGLDLVLRRSYSSLSEPRGEFGVGWTMNLPSLAVRPRLQRRERDGEDGNELLSVLDLFDRLGGVNLVFERTSAVAGFSVPLLVSEDDSLVLGIGGARRNDIGSRTRVAFLRDGSEWHFDYSGALAAIVEGRRADVYRRHSDGRLHTLEGWVDGILLGRIELSRDKSGRIVKVEGSNGESVVYVYDGAGRLTAAVGEAVERYEYDRGLLSSITRGPAHEAAFRYDLDGRLVAERRGDGPWISAAYARGEDGVVIDRTLDDGTALDAFAADASGRPRWHARADGVLKRWRFDDDGAVLESVLLPDGSETSWELTADGRTQRYHPLGGAPYEAVSDASGRLVSLRDGDGEALRMDWADDGRWERLSAGAVTLEPEYAGASLREVRVSNAAEPGRAIVVGLDGSGRARRISDGEASDVELTYAADGGLARIASADRWAEATRDAEGRLVAWRTSWGRGADWEYDARGDARVSKVNRGDQEWAVTYDGDDVTSIAAYEGGSIELAYDEVGGRHVLRRLELPGGTRAAAVHDDAGRLLRYTYDMRAETRFAWDGAGRIVSVRRAAVTDASPLRELIDGAPDRRPASGGIPDAW